MPIYVVGHKNFSVPNSDLYDTIAVGPDKNFSTKYRDDVGINIAHLNKYYCELTAYYSIWKNIDSDFVGICHYRRFFNLVPINNYKDGWIDVSYNESIAELLSHDLQKERINELLGTYDMVIPRYWPAQTNLRDSYLETQNSIEWDIFIEELDLLYGVNGHPLRLENRNTYGNMLICKKYLFDIYCQQLFFVINRVFQRVGIYDEIPGKRYQNFRYPGYLAERFLTAFIYAHKLRCFEAQVICLTNL